MNAVERLRWDEAKAGALRRAMDLRDELVALASPLNPQPDQESWLEWFRALDYADQAVVALGGVPMAEAMKAWRSGPPR